MGDGFVKGPGYAIAEQISRTVEKFRSASRGDDQSSPRTEPIQLFRQRRETSRAEHDPRQSLIEGELHLV